MINCPDHGYDSPEPKNKLWRFLKSFITTPILSRFVIWFVGITIAVATVGTASGSFAGITVTIGVVAFMMAAFTGPDRRI